MKDEIESRLATNLERVQHLVKLYQGAAGRPRRRRVDTTDVLRAAVVLLHATLEDFLRSLLEWKLPESNAVHLKEVPLAGKKARSTFTLDDLAAFRGRTVNEVIVQSVQASLDRSNFNHPGEVERALQQIGLSSNLLGPHKDALGTLMVRRQWIVHRVDRGTSAESGPGATQAIEQAAVEEWFQAVRQLSGAMLREL